MSKSSANSFAIRSQRVVTSAGVRPAVVVIAGEKISEILPHETLLDGIEVDDVGELVISPGVIDAHVHINEPGTDWEGFETATRAAAAGGVTTIVDMPLNSLPVTTNSEALVAKQEAAEGKCWVDVGFYGGLVQGNAGELSKLCQDGVLGVKAFLCHSGLDEFPNALEADLRTAMPLLAAARVPLLVHAELLTTPAPPVSDVRSFSQFVTSRPEQWELAAIRLLIDLCRETRCHVHIVHLATGGALPLLAAAKRAGLPITVETCPHYLFFDPAEVPDGDTRFKCAPPIRTGAQAELWQGLLEGVIDTIGSDHSPCPPGLKHLETGDFSQAWGGISSLQLTLPAVWSVAKNRGDDDLQQLSQWLSAHPAQLAGLAKCKGQITAGWFADLVVWDPAARWQVDAKKLFHRHPVTPYDGRELRGEVQRTYVRGRLVYRDGQHVGEPRGCFQVRGE